MAPKARKNVFYGSPESESALFLYRRPQSIYADLTSKLQHEQTTGTPPFCFRSVVSPIWQIGKKKMPKIVRFFRYSARSPHRATKPSRVWLRVIIRKLPLVLFALDRAANEVTAKARACWRGGVGVCRAQGPGRERKAAFPGCPRCFFRFASEDGSTAPRSNDKPTRRRSELALPRAKHYHREPQVRKSGVMDCGVRSSVLGGGLW